MAKKTVWAPMPPSKRAKQFVPFQALKGLNEAIANKERLITPRRELTEDSIAEINYVLVNLVAGSLVTAVYYCDMEQEYHQLTGYVNKVDPLCKCLQIGNVTIDFRDLSNLWTTNS
ncbi:MAG: YolD-like family protein [Oscillospiraceae bacterium]|nr:YolD-like family protein [Oscillospiraceae bacterium]